MPRFYFHLKSKDSDIPDDSGKELRSLNDAYDHARKLIEKIWLHIGHEDSEEWNVIISNDEFNASLIVPMSFSYLFSKRRKSGDEKDGHRLIDNENSSAYTACAPGPSD
jgi:Domain of unknown function (DUF6894)